MTQEIPEASYEAFHDSGALILLLVGRLDALGVRQIAPDVDVLADQSLPLIFDLTGVTFMDSLGVALLVRVGKRYVQAGVPVGVVPGSPQVARLLGIARLDRMLLIGFTRESILEAFKASRQDSLP